jgi:hypothetical protein
MKRIFLLVIIAIFVNCTKHTEPALVGTWALVMKTSEMLQENMGWANQEPYSKPPQILKFTKDSLSVLSMNATDTTVRHTKYHVIVNTIYTDDNGQALGTYIFKTDTLLINKDIQDAGKGYTKCYYVHYKGPLMITNSK